MTAARIVGTILIVIGLVAFLSGGISWTREKTVIDLGSVKAKTETHERIPVPPVLGAIVLVAGIVLLVIPGRRRV